MSEEVTRRFRQKVETIKDRLTFIVENFVGIVEVQENRILKKALYKEYQELVEAASDVCAMILKEEGMMIKDDYTNLEGLRFLFVPEMIKGLKRANGLRNVLVHEYSGVIDKRFGEYERSSAYF